MSMHVWYYILTDRWLCENVNICHSCHQSVTTHISKLIWFAFPSLLSKWVSWVNSLEIFLLARVVRTGPNPTICLWPNFMMELQTTNLLETVRSNIFWSFGGNMQVILASVVILVSYRLISPKYWGFGVIGRNSTSRLIDSYQHTTHNKMLIVSSFPEQKLFYFLFDLPTVQP